MSTPALFENVRVWICAHQKSKLAEALKNIRESLPSRNPDAPVAAGDGELSTDDRRPPRAPCPHFVKTGVCRLGKRCP
ncbi:unnamed protein product, partial [Cyprideis torosa]